jgi:hypothetical protein
LFRQRPVFPWQATLLPAILIVTIMVKRQG